MARTSRLDEIMEFADNIDAYDQKQKAKEQIKLLFLEVIESKRFGEGDDETFAYYVNPVLDELRQLVEAL